MTVKFYTLGCKVNQYETEAMKEAFSLYGIKTTENGADIIVINSCSVTAESDRKTRQLVNRAKRENDTAVVVLTGCMVQAFPEAAKNTKADIVIGNSDVLAVVEKAVNYAKSKSEDFYFTPHFTGEKYNTPGIASFDERTRAFMKIEDGCDRFCTYCIIPYARGRVRSRALSDIKAEAEKLAKNGYKEIVLVGINLSAYGKGENFDLCDAVDSVCSVSGIKRVRLGSIEPDHITDDMLKRFSHQEKFCPQFHLSLQSGSDNTLKTMNRHYDTAFYLDLVNRIRKVFECSAITTDIMVGFSGETEEDFLDSMSFVKKVGFARVHVFPYSVRKGTKAESFSLQVPAEIKKDRAKRMQEAARTSEKEFLSRMVGKTFSVLFEKNNEGYTENYSKVIVENEDIKEGEIKKVKIVKSLDTYLLGTIEK
ncbi:MAG: tRNA (N(6)-L-threonylcarbamoyladenosine(37)-C(2))-methylthiotransferase MtaB [Clostridia bacterium]|nr:tRNA (N(6)-L-threonylcarbamoyladenosine(37)-C(2))-methylthiotransferase MtaB [Clostridia bacterium]